MTNDDGRKPEGGSAKAGGGAPSGVDGNGPKRFSVQRKMAIVARLLRGEPLELVAREANVSIARLTEHGHLRALQPLLAIELLVANDGWVASAVKAVSRRRRWPERPDFVCQAWTLDWRCKSSAEQVGSNRKPKATACRLGRRETIRLGAVRPCGEEAGGALQHRT